MNWQHLIYFKTVTEMKSYSKAAEALYITPSALSKAIHNLETELGFPLFNRVGRSSVLTRYGESFYECIYAASNSINGCIQSIHDEMGLVNGRIRIGGIYTMCSEYLPGKIKEVKALYPDVRIDLYYYTTDIILCYLLDGSLDLGFCGDFDPSQKMYANLERFFIKSEEIVVIVPKNSALAKRTEIDFSALQGEKFIIQKNSNVGTNYIFRQLCAQNHIVPDIAFEVPDDQSILGLVENDLGVAIMADSLSLRRDGIHILHISGQKVPVRNQYMVWNKTNPISPITKAFRRQIMENRGL